MARKKDIRCIDLFAGIGGIRLGFEQGFGARCKTVFVSEFDKQAVAVYKANFHDKFDISGDITKIPAEIIPEFDVCLAGFPCQAFSIAGNRLGFDDSYKGMSRGTLFSEVIRICEAHKPKVIFCENVKGLIHHKKGQTLSVILGAFSEIGYDVYYKVLKSQDYGVPQTRERIYIVCIRKDINPLKKDEDFPWPAPVMSEKKDIESIMEKEAVSPKYYLSETYLACLERHKQNQKQKGNGFGYVIRDKKSVASTILCGGMGRERNLIIDERQKDLTPVTKIKGKINDKYIRRLTPREWANLQGFPEDFKLSNADTNAYKQLGNTVTVPVIKSVAEKIKELLKL